MIRVVLIVAALATVGAARAEKDRDKARVVYAEGARLYEKGEWERALRMFQQAHVLSHEPAMYFNMAACEEKLRHFRAASLLLRQYLLERPRAEDRAQTEARIRALEEEERKQASAPAPAPAPAIAPAPVAAPAPPPVPVAPVGDARPRKISWALAGVTGALAVTSIALGATALVRHGDLRSSCSADGAAGCTQGQVDGVRALALSTDVMIGVTALAAAVTVVLLIVEPRLGRAAAHALAGGVVRF